MPNTKTKKFDWQIFLAVSCILLVICCATICCVIGNTENGVANAYEPESVVANTNNNISILDGFNNNRYNLIYFNPYADFNIAFTAMYIYSDLRYSGDYAVNFFTIAIDNTIIGKSFFINYPDENKYVFVVTSEEGYGTIESTSFRDYYPTSSSLLESYAPDFARIFIVCDFDTQNYQFSVSTLLYSDIAGFGTGVQGFEVLRNYDIADETGLYFMDTMFSYNTNFFVTDFSFHDLPRFKFIDNDDIAYLNYRISVSDYNNLLNLFVNQEDFMSSPYYDEDIYDGEIGILFATFSNGVDTYKFYYSWTWGGFVFIKNDSELLEILGYSRTNFGFRCNFVSLYTVYSTYTYNYNYLDERLYNLNVVSTTPIFDEYYYEFHTMFSGTYNFLTYDTALMYKVIGTASDTAYENGYQTGVNEGYNQGFSAGHTAGYDTGHDAGYDEGYDVGHDAGYEEGYDAGLDAGYQNGYHTGYDVGYEEGYDEGVLIGSQFYKDMTYKEDLYRLNESTPYESYTRNILDLTDFLTYVFDVNQRWYWCTSYSTTSIGGGVLYYPTGVKEQFDNIGDVLTFYIENGSSPIYCIYDAGASALHKFSDFVYMIDGYDFSIMLNDGYALGFQQGINAGYKATELQLKHYEEIGFERGKSQGLEIGRQEGYNQGVLDANDYSFFGLFTAIFDAPISSIVGKWGDSDGDGVYEREGGMLNFYIPGLDINFAPFLLSLFTIAIIVMIIRFILARKS